MWEEPQHIFPGRLRSILPKAPAAHKSSDTAARTQDASYNLIRQVSTKETARRLYDGPVFCLSFWTGRLFREENMYRVYRVYGYRLANQINQLAGNIDHLLWFLAAQQLLHALTCQRLRAYLVLARIR